MGGGPPEGRGPRRARPALDRPGAAPGAVRAPGCSGGTGVQEAPGETGVFTGPGDRLLWAVRGSFRALPPVSCTVPPRRPSPHVGVSPGRAWPVGGAGSPCCPLCLDPPGRLPRASLRFCAPHAGPLRVPVSLCAGQARRWARTAPCCLSEHPALPQSSLSAPCLSVWPAPPQSKWAARPAPRSAGASLRRSQGSAPYRSAAPGGLPGRGPLGDGARGWGARPGGARGGVRA